ncbi:MAG: hypothetical protein AAF360_17735 [Pseudomonadota bacterium]
MWGQSFYFCAGRGALTAGRRFVEDRSGAVALDWVALTATIVVIGISLSYAVFQGDSGSVSSIINSLSAEMTVAAGNLVDAVPTDLAGFKE